MGGNRRRPVNPDTNEKLFSARDCDAEGPGWRRGRGRGRHTKKVSRERDLPNVSRVCCRCEPCRVRMGNVGGGEMSVRGEAKRRAGGSEKEETRRLDCARQSRCNQEKPRLATRKRYKAGFGSQGSVTLDGTSVGIVGGWGARLAATLRIGGWPIGLGGVWGAAQSRIFSLATRPGHVHPVPFPDEELKWGGWPRPCPAAHWLGRVSELGNRHG